MRTSGMALRNLGRQKKRTFLLGGAIAFGLLIVTLLNGFAGSFIENVGENFSHLFAGHIFIDGVEKLPSGRMVSRIRNDEIITNAIEAIGIPYRYLTKQSEFSGTLIFEGESVRQNVRGIEWDKESFFKERLILAEGSFDGMADPRGIIVSAKIAEKLDVRIGDRMLVQLTTATGQQNVGEFVLAATILDPGMMGSISAYADLDYVNELLNLAEGEYMTLGIFLEDMDMIDSEGNRLYEYLKGKVDLFDRDSTETEENPFLVIMNQVKEEQWEGTRYRFYTLNDMLEEDKEIGTMRALGMQRTEVRRLFLAEAFYLALGGVAAGMAASGIVMFVLSRINWGTDTPIFILLKNGYMTFKLLPWQVLLNTAVIILMTLFAAFSPARKAALLEPADALRTIK